MRGSACDASKHFGRLSFESWATSPPNVSEEGLQLTPQLLSNWRLGLMLVDDAAACRFEARSQGRGSVSDVGIDNTRDVAWLEAKKPGLDQEKELSCPSDTCPSVVIRTVRSRSCCRLVAAAGCRWAVSR